MVHSDELRLAGYLAYFNVDLVVGVPSLGRKAGQVHPGTQADDSI